MGCCGQVDELRARLAAKGGEIDPDMKWLLEQVTGWQTWAGRVVEFGGLVQNLRALESSDSRIAVVLQAYEHLFNADAFGR